MSNLFRKGNVIRPCSRMNQKEDPTYIYVTEMLKKNTNKLGRNGIGMREARSRNAVLIKVKPESFSLEITVLYSRTKHHHTSWDVLSTRKNCLAEDISWISHALTCHRTNLFTLHHVFRFVLFRITWYSSPTSAPDSDQIHPTSPAALSEHRRLQQHFSRFGYTFFQFIHYYVHSQCIFFVPPS